jgi:hypothetical protein
MSLLVAVGFHKMLKFIMSWLRRIVMSRMFNVLFASSSKVNCSLGLNVLNCCNT